MLLLDRSLVVFSFPSSDRGKAIKVPETNSRHEFVQSHEFLHEQIEIDSKKNEFKEPYFWDFFCGKSRCLNFR